MIAVNPRMRILLHFWDGYDKPNFLLALTYQRVDTTQPRINPFFLI
jgi:hypothetical protein